MFFLLLMILEDANGGAVDIFNKLDNDKKLALLQLLRQVFLDEFDEELSMYKKIYKIHEDKKLELEKLLKFGIEQGYINEATSLTDDIDQQLFNNLNNMNEDMDM